MFLRMMNREQVVEALRLKVLGLRDAGTGVWTGELAPSALSTALATAVLLDGDADDARRARAGVRWLIDNVNADGGWGDTPDSPSNLSATLIARGAVEVFARKFPRGLEYTDGALAGSGGWVIRRVGSLEFPGVVRALRGVYGEDRTFAAPILAFLALCGSPPPPPPPPRGGGGGGPP
ncbi:MAG: hypothetical protein FWH21_04765, partial [Kiritimatiellaeota bacterium]|nr:hypothetical protein [Kiritimatiellota bacterium]